MANTEESRQNDLADELARLVAAIGKAGRIGLPGSPDELLKSIVEAAARIFGAAAASILLVNEAEGVMEFKVAHGAGSDGLVGVRIPLNQGIAGYVAMSGQPIAISDVAQDTRFNRDFAKSTGYVPRSILAAPLRVNDRVIGVMEVLDKISGPSFGIQDMELLGLFSRQAALAIDLARSLDDIDGVLRNSLIQLAKANPQYPADHLVEGLETARDSASQQDLQKLVDLLLEFGHLGDSEREMALKILAAFADYSRNQRRMNLGESWR